jgi:hypothetical protein
MFINAELDRLSTGNEGFWVFRAGKASERGEEKPVKENRRSAEQTEEHSSTREKESRARKRLLKTSGVDPSHRANPCQKMRRGERCKEDPKNQHYDDRQYPQKPRDRCHLTRSRNQRKERPARRNSERNPTARLRVGLHDAATGRLSKPAFSAWPLFSRLR